MFENEIKLAFRWITIGVIFSASVIGIGCGAAKMTTAPSASGSLGNLAASTSSLKFGTVQVGSSRTLPLTVSNAGGQGTTVRVSALTVTGAGFTATGAATPFTLASGQTLTVNVKLVPQAAGNLVGNLSIASDAANSNLSIGLSGTGANAATGQLSVSPTVVNFGDVTLGSSLTQLGTLLASGNSVTVSSASWNGTGFSLSGLSFPLTIAAGQSVPFSVTFAPQSVGNISGGVSFLSNASNASASEQWSGVGAQVSQHQVDLSWNASSGSVQGYYVYRGFQSGGPYAKLSPLQGNTMYTDAAVASGQTYYYVVTALGTNAVESGFSNESIASVP